MKEKEVWIGLTDGKSELNYDSYERVEATLAPRGKDKLENKGEIKFNRRFEQVMRILDSAMKQGFYPTERDMIMLGVDKKELSSECIIRGVGVAFEKDSEFVWHDKLNIPMEMSVGVSPRFSSGCLIVDLSL